MTIMDVLNHTTIDPTFSGGDNTAIQAALTALYNGSATARSLLDQVDSGDPLAINFLDDKFEAVIGGFELRIDVAYWSNVSFFNAQGDAISYTLALALAHELVHAIGGLNDTLTPPDFAGDTVDYTNAIHDEMGAAERLSLKGVSFATRDSITAGLNYTNGATIDVAITVDNIVSYSGTYDADSESHSTNSRDLLVGSNSLEDTLSGGAGNDFLYGNDEDDELNGEDGDDLLVGGAGGDDMDGGNGTDTLSYYDATSGVTINLNAGTASGGEATGDTIANCENIIGSDFVDTLTGSSSANNIQGGDGNDTILGLGGDDTILGGDGDDTINGGSNSSTETLNGGNGTDTLSYSDATSGVTINLTANTASGGEATSDAISNFENIVGSSYVDTLTGTSGVNNIQGGDGDDTILGGGSGDTLNGGNGTDTLSYVGSAAVTVNLGAGTASGGDAASDAISNAENLIGSSNADTLTGSSGVNTIEGGAGGDTLDGGADTDTLSYAGSSSGVTVSIGSNTASGGDAASDTISNFENIIGSGYADDLTGTNSANTIQGGVGDDEITGLQGDDLLVGGTGEDLLIPGLGDDTIVLGTLDAAHLNDAEDYGDEDGDQNTVNWVGGHGADIVIGFKDASATNADILSITGLGATDLRVFIDEPNDRISFINRSDAANSITFVEANNSYDFTSGGTQHLSFTSSNVQFAGGSTLFLQDTTLEVISGSSQSDYLIGSIAGNDTFTVTAGSDWFDGLGGTNEVSFAGSGVAVNVTLDTGTTELDALGVNADKGTAVIGKYTNTLLHIQNITGSDVADTINGTTGANTLNGGSGNDTIFGWNGADTISGGANADTLCGDEAADSLTGGSGADTFQYFGFYVGGADPGGLDTGIGSGNRDVINDFSQAQGDQIGFYTDYSGMKFIGTKAFTGTAKQINYASGGGVTIIGGDIDANGTLDFEIELTGTFTLTGSDFILT